jgi:hypothetical protein
MTGQSSLPLTVLNRMRQKIIIPSWLEDSDFFSSLTKDCVLPINTPIKLNTNVTSFKELKLILEVIKFWGVREIPASIFLFIASEKNTQLLHKFFDEEKKNFDKDFIRPFIPFIGLDKELWCSTAVKMGHLPLLKEMRKRYAPWNEDITTLSAEMKRSDIFIYCAENKCRFTKKAMDKACESGDLTIFKYMVEIFVNQGTYYTNYEHYRTAAKNGHLHILIYIRSMDTSPWLKSDLLSLTIANGQFECFTYLCDSGIYINSNDFIMAAKRGYKHYIDYLLLSLEIRRVDIDEVKKDPDIIFAIKEDLEMAEYLINKGFNWNLCVFVTKNLNVMIFFHEKSMQKFGKSIWTTDLLEWAFDSGYMDIVDYLIKHDCPKDVKKLIKLSVNRDDFSRVKYLSQFL